jgi:transcriptional regulator
MYSLSQYLEKDRETILAFMQQYPFATVTGIGEQYPVASHLPLGIEVTDDKIIFRGHLMKKTDHHLAFEKNQHVLVIFHGPHCYISASWYSNPQTASTWNYMTVHAKGNIRFSDEEGTYNEIKRITEKYEGAASAAAFDKMPEDYKRHMAKAIVGFSIEVESLDALFKLSQNRDEPSKKNIIEQLTKQPDEGSLKIAAEMQSRLAQ